MSTLPMQSIAQAGLLGASKTSMAGEAAAASSAAPFSGLLSSIVAQTGALDARAHEAVTGLLNGSGVDVHQAMIATQQADGAFQLALEVRNKAVGAYQQMMQMQF